MAAIDLESRLVTRLVGDDVLGGHVHTTFPRERAPIAGRLFRIPGSHYIDTNTKTLETVRIQVDVYGPKIGTMVGPKPADVATFDAINELLDALVALEAQGLGPTLEDPPDVFVTEVDITSTPWRADDPDNDLAGYKALINVFARAYRHVG